MATTRRYGWRRARHTRDLKRLGEPRRGTPPPRVDLRPGGPALYDQEGIGSCTGNAYAAMLQYDEIAQGKSDTSTPSRLFIYYNERLLEGTTRSDAGACIPTGLKALHRWGYCPESLWTYDGDGRGRSPKFARRPPKAAYDAARRERIQDAHLVPQDLRAIKSVLAGLQGPPRPVVGGISLFASFEGEEAIRTGAIPMPAAGEEELGGHAVLYVGYDDDRQCLLGRNSWGPGWGDGGHFWLPYAYWLDPELGSDNCTVTFVP